MVKGRASRAARSVVPVTPEIRRLLAAILLFGAAVILAAAVAGCERAPRWIIVEKSGVTTTCPYGLVWMADQDQVLCRVETADGGFRERIVPVSAIRYVDAQ